MPSIKKEYKVIRAEWEAARVGEGFLATPRGLNYILRGLGVKYRWRRDDIAKGRFDWYKRNIWVWRTVGLYGGRVYVVLKMGDEALMPLPHKLKRMTVDDPRKTAVRSAALAAIKNGKYRAKIEGFGAERRAFRGFFERLDGRHDIQERSRMEAVLPLWGAAADRHLQQIDRERASRRRGVSA